tara:strand:+ start:1116 stop:2102 length:987 start_codon:yes stop_codon:yes gene_type:complete
MGVIITFIYRNKNHISEMKSLLGDTKLSLADVGAAGGLDKRWHFLRPTNLTEILFEPDPASFKELQNKSLPNTLVFNAALADSKKEVILNICKWRQVSSIYEPNFELINKYPDASRFEIEERIPLKADSLSNLLYSKNVSALDFIKIDTQGSELEILRGAGDLLRSVIGVEVEVEFVELYKGQPLFQEVNSYISNWGMSLVDLKRTFWKRESLYQNTRKGQLIYADALYLREPEALLEDNCDEERLIKALVIYLAYGYSDLAISLTMSALSKNIISPESADRFLNSIKKEFLFPDFKGKKSLKGILDFASKHLNENVFSTHTDQKLGN